MAVEVILFDLGKVIIDFDGNEMVRQLSACCSKSVDEFERVLCDSKLAHRYETGAITTEQFYHHLIEFGGLQMTMPAFLKAWSSVFKAELMISEDLLKTLRRRYPLILVSNTNEAHVEFIAKNYPVFDYFEHKVFSFEVHVMKPDRGIYECAIALSRTRPEALFFVDDREENVQGARELGIPAHQFKTEAGLIAALRDSGIDL